MANVIKYKTSQPTKRGLRRDNIVIGIGEENYGPSSTTGYFNGVTPPDGGFVVYTIDTTNDPIAYIANSDSDLINIANTLGGSISTVNDAKVYLSGRVNTLVLDSIPQNTDTEDLLFHFDFSEPYCYPGSGVVYYDLSGNNYHASASSDTTYVEYDSNYNVVNFGGGEVDGHGLFVQDLNYVTGDSDELEELTIDTLIKTSTLSSNSSDQRIILSFDRSSVFRFSVGGDSGAAVSNPGKLSFMSPQTGDKSATNCPDLRDDKWHRIALTFKSGTGNGLRYYVDGELVETDTSTYSPIGSQGTSETPRYGVIGAGSEKSNDTPGSSTAPDSIFTGSMASIKYYNKQLSQSEILQNYYGAPIVTDGLVLAMDAGNLVSYESGSTTTYSMTGSLSGSLTNGVGFSNNKGGSWDFDGSDDFISIPTYTFGNGDWTLSMWVNADSFANYNLMSNSSGGPVSNTFGAYGNTPTIFYQNYDGAWQSHYGNTTLLTGEWYLLTWVNYQGATNSDGTMKMFVNGIADSDVFNSYTTNGGPCNVIGKRWASTTFNGKIANVYIQTKSLLDSEVLQNYNAQKSRFGI